MATRAMDETTNTKTCTGSSISRNRVDKSNHLIAGVKILRSEREVKVNVFRWNAITDSCSASERNVTFKTTSAACEDACDDGKAEVNSPFIAGGK
jgi:hypothetical protein